MRTSRRNGMYDTAIPPVTCGLIDGTEPMNPVAAFGSLGFTDATSKAGAAGDCDCANAFAHATASATPRDTTTRFFIRSILLSRGSERATAQVARRQRALH